MIKSKIISCLGYDLEKKPFRDQFFIMTGNHFTNLSKKPWQFTDHKGKESEKPMIVCLRGR